MTVIIEPTVYTPPLGDALEFNLATASVGREAYIIDPSTGICIAGVQVTDLSAAFAPLDITDNNSNGFRELLPECGLQTYDFSISGIIKDGNLRTIAQDGNDNIDLTNYKFKWADGSELTMDYKMSNYVETYPTNEAATFTATILTSGFPSIA